MFWDADFPLSDVFMGRTAEYNGAVFPAGISQCKFPDFRNDITLCTGYVSSQNSFYKSKNGNVFLRNWKKSSE